MFGGSGQPVPVLVAMLQHLGFSVTAARDAHHALREVARDGSWDVLVTDYHMPEMLGTTLAREVRRMAPAIWIVLCSGTDPRSIESVESSGVDVAVSKPATLSALAEAVAPARRTVSSLPDDAP